MPGDGNEVRFEDNANEFGAPPERSGGFDLTAMLVRSGVVSSAQQAQYVLIGVAVVILLIAGYFMFGSVSGGELQPPVYSNSVQ